MTENRRPLAGWLATADSAIFLILILWVIWLPLPFGSVTEVSQPALLLFPLYTCLTAALLRWPDRKSLLVPRSFVLLASGAVVFAAWVALQIAPLGSTIVAAISPRAHAIWSAARPIYALTRNASGSGFPHAEVLSIAPSLTLLNLFRFLSYLAAFSTAALLIRTTRRRCILAGALGLIALFEVAYGVRELTLRHFEIWGWENELILDRVSGTYVNPNHFAHHLAIILPLGLFLVGVAWLRANAGARGRLAGVARLLERQFVLSAWGVLIAAGCLVGILVAQSRGALLASIAGVGLVAGTLLYRRRQGRRREVAYRMMAAAIAVVVGLLLLVAILGTDRTIQRFRPGAGEASTAVGRTSGIVTALRIWTDFPISGSGLGTFEQIVQTRQTVDLGKILNHAHCDYAEILATTGIGFLVAFLTIAIGYFCLWRETLHPGLESRKHFLFLLAALASISVAAIHALFDFNFFIPANAATLAVIAGAACSIRDEGDSTSMRRRLRRSREVPVSELGIVDPDPAL